jgi:hypothetical protein
VRLLHGGWLGPPVVCWMRDSETACMPCVCSEFDVRVCTRVRLKWCLWECVLVWLYSEVARAAMGLSP